MKQEKQRKGGESAAMVAPMQPGTVARILLRDKKDGMSYYVQFASRKAISDACRWLEVLYDASLYEASMVVSEKPGEWNADWSPPEISPISSDHIRSLIAKKERDSAFHHGLLRKANEMRETMRRNGQLGGDD